MKTIAFRCDFEWVVGEWEPCSATCGTKGVQHREIYCVPKSVLNKFAKRRNATVLVEPWKFMVNPKRCFDMSPLTEQYCNRIPCPTYWTFSEWSQVCMRMRMMSGVSGDFLQCSTSCGGGFSTRNAECFPPEGETLFTCGEAPPYQKRTCDGPYTRHNNVLCKGRKKRYCHNDESDFCSISLLSKYCRINSFRRICCKTCSSVFRLTPVSA